MNINEVQMQKSLYQLAPSLSTHICFDSDIKALRGVVHGLYGQVSMVAIFRNDGCEFRTRSQK